MPSETKDISWVTFFGCYAITTFVNYVVGEATRRPIMPPQSPLLGKVVFYASYTAASFLPAIGIVFLLYYIVRFAKHRAYGIAKPKMIALLLAIGLTLLGFYGRCTR